MKAIRACWVMVLWVALAGAGVARADMPTTVQKKLRGTILLTAAPLPLDVGDDRATLAKYRSLRAGHLSHQIVDDVPTWTFHYTAFLKRTPKTDGLSIDFHTADGKKVFVANKRLIGVDPKVKVLSGELTMSEDDNLNKGRTYHVEVTVQKGRRHIVLAKTKVRLK